MALRNLLGLFRGRAAVDPAALTTKEQKHNAISAANSIDELDQMWWVWEGQGWSRGGLLYAAILERKQALGAVLEQDQRDTIALAAKRRAAGATLTPITGHVGPKEG